jgi:hypothetical protein
MYYATSRPVLNSVMRQALSLFCITVVSQWCSGGVPEVFRWSDSGVTVV